MSNIIDHVMGQITSGRWSFSRVVLLSILGRKKQEPRRVREKKKLRWQKTEVGLLSGSQTTQS